MHWSMFQQGDCEIYNQVAPTEVGWVKTITKEIIRNYFQKIFLP
jgi:hypothetical protein